MVEDVGIESTRILTWTNVRCLVQLVRQELVVHGMLVVVNSFETLFYGFVVIDCLSAVEASFVNIFN